MLGIPYLKTFLMHIRSRNKPRYGLGETESLMRGIGLVYHKEGQVCRVKFICTQTNDRRALIGTPTDSVCWIINSRG
jgi:hypothetical protein